MVARTPTLTLFPYTTLFRSERFIGGPHRRRAPPALPRGDRADCRGEQERQVHGVHGVHGKRVLPVAGPDARHIGDRKSTRLNSSHPSISYAGFCLKKKNASS